MFTPCRVPIGSLALTLALTLAATAADPPAAPSIRLRPEPGSSDLTRARFEVFGLSPAALKALAATPRDDEHWHTILAVRPHPGPILKNAPPPDRPPLDGTYRVVGAVLQFTPREPLQPGQRYRARLDPSQIAPNPGIPGGTGTIFAVFDLPEPKKTPSRLDPTPPI